MRSSKSSALTMLGLLLCVSTSTFADNPAPALKKGQPAPVWQPSPGHTQIPIWPGAAPSALPAKGPEFCTEKDGLGNVTRPTITVYSPKGKNTGAAVVIFPGGGYQILAMDLEGTEVCDWLNSIGVTAVLLKYRVPSEKMYPAKGSPQALQDAQRAIRIVRSRAKEWHIDPHKIGVIGFSAGGHLVAATSTRYDERLYPPVDATDKESCRPDFALPIYPGHLWIDDKKFELNPDIRVTSKTPPTFLLQNEDDPVDPVQHSLVYYNALRKAKVPVEMHLYAEGGHAFGLRPSKLPVSKWPRLAEIWLETIGMIPKSDSSAKEQR
jgi:acetyl esterase/lipase